MARIEFHCSDEQKEKYIAAAKRDRRSLGDWMRLVADQSSGLITIQNNNPEPRHFALADGSELKLAPGEKKPLSSPIVGVVCDHAGTEIGKVSGVGTCPKCGKMVTVEEVGK